MPKQTEVTGRTLSHVKKTYEFELEVKGKDHAGIMNLVWWYTHASNMVSQCQSKNKLRAGHESAQTDRQTLSHTNTDKPEIDCSFKGFTPYWPEEFQWSKGGNKVTCFEGTFDTEHHLTSHPTDIISLMILHWIGICMLYIHVYLTCIFVSLLLLDLLDLLNPLGVFLFERRQSDVSLSRRVSVLSWDGTSNTIVGWSRTHRPETVTFEEGTSFMFTPFVRLAIGSSPL